MTLVAGRYELQGELGRGASSVVYRALDTSVGAPVAVKVLLDAWEAERFERETRAVTRLDHPSIVRVRDAGRHEGRPFIVMDLVAGETLDGVIRRGPLEVERAVAIARDVALALEHAHERGVVHRDVKPSNVIVGPDGRAHLVDFGLARAVDDASLTGTGVVVGTPSYMAPEQADGRPAGPLSDVYSVGATLHAALAGSPPFKADGFEGLLRRIVVEPPVPLRRFRPDVPATVEVLVLRCLEKAPERRFPSAAALARALGDSAKAPAPSRRAPLLALGGGVVLALGALGAYAVARERTGAPPPPPPATPAVLPAAPPRTNGLPPRAWLEKARASLRRDELERAETEATGAIEAAPADPEAWALRGATRARRRRMLEAETDFARALELDDKRAATWSARAYARAHSSRAEREQVIRDARCALELDPLLLEPHLAAAYVLYSEAALEESLTATQAAVDAGPSSGEAWALRGEILFAAGRTDEAFAAIARSIEIEPGSSEGYRTRAIMEFKLQRVEAARASIDAALERRPRAPDALAIRARVRRALGDLDGAAGDASLAARLDPECAFAHVELARVAIARGDLAGAEEAFTAAIEVRPRQPSPRAFRARVREDRGDVTGAIADYEVVLGLVPNSPHGTDARERIARLRARPDAPR